MAAHVYEDDEMAADCATLEALLSARPLALGGQQGEDEIAFLLDRLADFENDINERDWHGHVAPAVARAKAALSTTPARAEAKDEGAAGESLDDVARRLFAAQYPGRDYDDLKDMVQIGWLRKAHDEILSARAHPSPTPAAEPRKVSALPLEGDPVQQMTGLTVADALDDPVSSLGILRALTTSRTLCVWADGTYRVMPTMDVPVARNEEGTLIGVIPMAEIGEVATPSAYEFQERIAELEAQLTAADADRVRIPEKWVEVAEYATERGLTVHESKMRLEEFQRVVTPQALAALKSTAMTHRDKINAVDDNAAYASELISALKSTTAKEGGE